jgi:hypothetical protein
MLVKFGQAAKLIEVRCYSYGVPGKTVDRGILTRCFVFALHSFVAQNYTPKARHERKNDENTHQHNFGRSVSSIHKFTWSLRRR